MHPVHLAKQSCETQDHRHGQKQFHPLIEPISTLHFAGETANLIRVTVHTGSAFRNLLVKCDSAHLSPVKIYKISVCETSEMFIPSPDTSTSSP